MAEARNEYYYSADGVKRKIVRKRNPNYSTTPVISNGVNTSSLTSKDSVEYAGNHIYRNRVLVRTLTENGYIENNVYHYYVQDYLGSNRVVVNTSNIQWTNYYPFGMIYGHVGSPEKQPYKYTGKEYDHTHGLNLYDYGARFYDPAVGRFLTMDPLAEKYHSISPYAYCLNNPAKYVDPDGRIPRIYVETKGVGHTFVTTGEGVNTTVYTYGRYGGLDKDKSIGRNLSRTGEGVLVIMRGTDALKYIEHEVKNMNASIYEIKNGSDEKIDTHFNTMFESSDRKPSAGKYKESDNARVIDTYDLLDNNCTTKSVEAIKISTNEKLDFKSNGPANINTKLYYENQNKDSQVKHIQLKDIYDEYKKY